MVVKSLFKLEWKIGAFVVAPMSIRNCFGSLISPSMSMFLALCVSFLIASLTPDGVMIFFFFGGGGGTGGGG